MTEIDIDRYPKQYQSRSSDARVLAILGFVLLVADALSILFLPLTWLPNRVLRRNYTRCDNA